MAKQAYYLYIQAGTVFLAVVFLLFQAGAKAFEVLSSFWLAKWADDTVAAEAAGYPLTDSQTMRYLLIYAAFGLSGVGFLIARDTPSHIIASGQAGDCMQTCSSPS